MKPSPEQLEKARVLMETLTDCVNCETKHCYAPGNERCDEIGHIAEALALERAESEKQIGKLVEAAKGYLGNGHEPTDGDVVHRSEHCRQCKLEEALRTVEEKK